MAALIVVITVSSPMLLAESSKHRLLPAARTFLTLQLCSSYLLEHEQDASLAEQYRNRAWQLVDAITTAGWSRDDFPVALMTAQEERHELAMKSSEPLSDFKRRYQWGGAVHQCS